VNPPPENKISPLTAPVTSVWGVGEERAKLLARLEIFTIEDLLLHKPRRYEDRRKFLPIRDLKLKEAATVRGKIIASGVKRSNACSTTARRICIAAGGRRSRGWKTGSRSAGNFSSSASRNR
jgi:ATP-dependent DNA helicase RecG